MNTINNVQAYGVNFGNKLVFSNVSNAAKKWQKISRTFEKAAQNSSIDMFVTKDSDKTVNIGISGTKSEIPNNLLLNEEISALFEDMSAEKILSKFFNLSDAISKEGDVAKGLQQLSSDEFFKGAKLV